MSQKITIFGAEYDVSQLTDTSKDLLNKLRMADIALQERSNMRAILTKAKKAYISDLKSEMLSAKSGFDFSE